MAFGIVKAADFANIQVSLESDEHPTCKKRLTGTWTAADFHFLPDSEELFKVVAKQKVNQILNQ